MNNSDLFEYAEQSDVIVEYGNLQINKALSMKIGQDMYIGMDKGIASDSAEERTLLAHELGHCATGAFYDISAPRSERRRMEHRAVRWAILRVVPKPELIRLIKEKYTQNEIADIFGVTEELIDTAYTYYFEYGIAG